MQHQRIFGQMTWLFAVMAVSSFGQTNSGYGWSNGWHGGSVNRPPEWREPAVPGTINYVEGQARLSNQNLVRSGQGGNVPAARTGESIGGSSLQAGQTLDTGDGYAEVLLAPGEFFE